MHTYDGKRTFFPFGLELFAPCRRAFIFTMPQKVDGNDRHSEGAVRITSNTLSQKGKEDFTESVLNTEATDGKSGKVLINK